MGHPKVGEPPSSSATAAGIEPVEATAPSEEIALQDAVDELVDDVAEPGETMTSLNDGYRMSEVGEWTIERVEPTYLGYPEGAVQDPLEQWSITHPEVDMQGEIILGADLGQTAPRPVFVVDAMTEEELLHLSSHYGNAYLVEGLIEVGGVEIYRVSIVTDHREDREVSEELAYFGNRTPAPRFIFQVHQIEPESFEAYLLSDARQDLLEMLRTLEIADPPSFEEGVDMQHPPWEE